MPNYQLSKIYKITSPHTDKCYVGASCQQYLSKRLSQHNTDFKRYCNGNFHYMTSFEIIELGDSKIELLESCPCSNKDELKVFESKWIRELDCVNKVIPDRTRKEWYDDNKDKNTEKSKQYYINNKDKKKEYDKQYQINNKDKINEKNKQWCNDNKEYFKQYHIDNKDKLKEYHKQWYIDNTDEQKQYQIDNADKIKEQKKQYRIDNKDKIKEQNKQRYMKKKLSK